MNMTRDEDGQYTAWRQRSEMADALGLSERQVKKAVDALKAKGLIETIGKSRSGCCQRYRIMPYKKGALYRGPIQEKGSPERVKKGPLRGSIRGTPTGDPFIKKRLEGDGSLPESGATPQEDPESVRYYAQTISGVV